MFRDSSAHLQEDTVVYMQHMVLSLSMRVRGGLPVHSLTPTYGSIKVKGANPRCQETKKRSHTLQNKPRAKVSVCQFSLKLCTDRPPETLLECDSTICCMYTTVSSWRWALEARNMYRKI